ncbi:MAG: TerC family protein [Bacteroidetes bacterium]|nr:TerC family protein [Bacteroidota bacterium]
MLDTGFHWILFNIFVVGMLALDLGVFHKKSHKVEIKEALIWSGVWIAFALIFALMLWMGWIYQGAYDHTDVTMKFLTGYLIEKSLSVDNVFVFVLLFGYFKVPSEYQHKVLFWGILGALIMRVVFIFAGVALINKFEWIVYVFGAFLIFTGIKIAVQKDKEMHPEDNPVLKLTKKFFRMTPGFVGDKFFVKKDKVKYATPLFAVLVLIETTDLIFAVDSIPAILSISNDPFIVYTSNVFAILGLRALYFALAGIMHLFHYLNYGLAVILSFVGTKMLLDKGVIATEISLIVIAGILALSVIFSLIFPKKKPRVQLNGLTEKQ